MLAAGELALTTRLVRTALLEALGTDYVRTARAKGLAERRVTGHALRNALLPVVTVIGRRIGMLCSGAVLVEAVFAWPGVGPALSLLARSYPVLLGIFLVFVFGGARQSPHGLASGWLDPRIRYDSRSAHCGPAPAATARVRGWRGGARMCGSRGSASQVS